MTGSRTAASFSEDGLNVVAKTPLERELHPHHAHAGRCGVACLLGGDDGHSLGNRDHHASLDSSNPLVTRAKAHVVCNLTDRAICLDAFQEQGLARRLSGERHRIRYQPYLASCADSDGATGTDELCP